MAKAATPRIRKKERKNIISGVAHVLSTFNNTMITISDAQGNAISWSSAGAQGFKGSGSPRRTRRRLRLKMPGARRVNTAWKRWKSKCPVLVRVVKAPCVPCRPLVSRSRLSVI